IEIAATSGEDESQQIFPDWRLGLADPCVDRSQPVLVHWAVLQMLVAGSKGAGYGVDQVDKKHDAEIV
ncbi:MAG: hypothetical protein AB1440_07690, partial [Pseudomonadota bacterium]